MYSNDMKTMSTVTPPPRKKKDDAPTPPTFGEGMVNITNLIGTRPDFKELTKPTQTENGQREFKDEKGVFFEMDQSKKKGMTTVAE